jgi:hypothetical protein
MVSRQASVAPTMKPRQIAQLKIAARTQGRTQLSPPNGAPSVGIGSQ